MRRTLALCAAAAVLRAAPAAADPMDLNLERLGAPAASVWSTVASRVCAASPGSPACALTAADAATLASESSIRYRHLVLQLGLGLTSFTLTEPTTTGMIGFNVGMEGAVAQVKHADGNWTQPSASISPPVSAWPVRGQQPTWLRLGALHVQKPMPYGFELGGRMIYVNQSQMAAMQLELRWVAVERWGSWPDLAVRAAFTRLFGQRDLELNVVDVDASVGKRFGVGGTLALMPYAAFRASMIGAKTLPIAFGPTTGTCASSTCYPDVRTPAEAVATTVPFPDVKFFDHLVWRASLGARLQSGAFTLGVETTYQPSKSLGAAENGQLAATTLPASFAAAFRLGFDF
jgi:hypothetical protein